MVTGSLRCEVCGNRITRERQSRHAKYCSPGCYRKAKDKRRSEVTRELRSDEAAILDGYWWEREGYFNAAK